MIPFIANVVVDVKNRRHQIGLCIGASIAWCAYRALAHLAKPDWPFFIASSAIGVVLIVIALAVFFHIVYGPEKRYGREDAIPVTLENICEIVSAEHCLEIEVFAEPKPLLIGTSSDCDKDAFFDKMYYIGDTEYEQLESFRQELSKRYPEGSVPVLTIDGLRPQDCNYPGFHAETK